MLTQFVAELAAFVIGSLFSMLEDVIPADALDWVVDLGANVAYLLSFGPASAIGIVFAIGLSVELAMNAYVFAVESYRLIPAKAT